MATIGVAGGTGFVGKHLVSQLVNKGYEVIIFSRGAGQRSLLPQIRYSVLDAEKKICNADDLAQLDAMVNLAGAGVADKRWTAERKAEIVSSRVDATNYLVNQLKLHAPACATYIASSAIGIYGPDKGDGHAFVETDAPYPDFLGETCKNWEASSTTAASTMRTVILRTGIVLGTESGAFPKFAGPLKFGIMPILGSGKQMVSWIEVDDLAGLMIYALENTKMKGTYNAVAPNPVRYIDLIKTIAKVKGGISIPAPAPGFMLKLMLGEMSVEILKSTKVSARKTLQSGFKFEFSDLEQAVRVLLKKK